MKNIVPFLMILVVINSFSQTKKAEVKEPKIEPIEIKAGDEIIEQTVGKEIEYSEVPFAVIEQIPLFPACEKVEKTAQRDCFYKQMQLHIKKNLKIPTEAENESQVIRIFVQFQIDKEGKVVHIKTRRSNYNSVYEAEVKRVIEKLPKFTPGIQRGKTVITSYALPINFSTN